MSKRELKNKIVQLESLLKETHEHYQSRYEEESKNMGSTPIRMTPNTRQVSVNILDGCFIARLPDSDEAVNQWWNDLVMPQLKSLPPYNNKVEFTQFVIPGREY